MSGDATISGRINISPYVTWGELHDKPWAIDADWTRPDVRLELETREEQGVSGNTILSRQGVAIVPTDHETSARTLLDDVARIVKAFPRPSDGGVRTYSGFLHVTWGYGQDLDVYRIVVREDGTVEEVRPEMTWPEGARDEDEAHSE